MNDFHKIKFVRQFTAKITILACLASLFDIIGISILYPYFLIIFDQIDLVINFAGSKVDLISYYPILENKHALSFLVLIIIVVSYLVRHLILRELVKKGHTLGLRISEAVACYLLYEKYAEVREISKSKSISILSAKINSSVYNVIIPITNLINSFSFLFISMMVCFYINFWYTVGAMFLALTIYSGLYLYNKMELIKISSTLNHCADLKLKSLNEITSSMLITRFYRIQSKIIKEFLDIDTRLRESQAKLQFINIISRVQIETIIIFLGVVSLSVISNLEVQSDKILINLSMILIISQKLISYSQQFYNNLTLMKGNLKDFEEVIAITSIGEKYINIQEDSLSREIEFDSLKISNLTYHIQNKTPILKNVNLRIYKGDKIAIVGASGVGKTTLFNLILGVLRPISGEVTLNDNEQDLLYLSKISSVITQSSFLTGGNIEDLIYKYAPYKKREFQQFEKYLGSYAVSLSKGADIEEGGENLSGGQRQRIAICQAIARDPQILFIDEGTSSLDVEIQDIILGELVSIPHLTIISITHRQETLDHFEKVFELKDCDLIQLK